MAEAGCTPGQAALAWVAGRIAPAAIPIVGARTAAQLRENLACLDIVLTDTQRQRLDDASSIDLGFPHDFLTREGTRPYLYGDFADRIDGPPR